MANEDQWTPEDFSRRHYTAEGSPQLNKAKRIELVIKIDGKPFVQIQAREPGMLAFVSKPSDDGFELEIIEAKHIKFSDIRTIEGNATEKLESWQLEALGLT